MNLSKWNKDDLAMHKMLDELLSRSATWNLNTAQGVQLYKSLVWFAQIRSKIEESQAEITSVRPLETVPEESKADAEMKVKKSRKPRTVSPAIAAGEGN